MVIVLYQDWLQSGDIVSLHKIGSSSHRILDRLCALKEESDGVQDAFEEIAVSGKVNEKCVQATMHVLNQARDDWKAAKCDDNTLNKHMVARFMDASSKIKTFANAAKTVLTEKYVKRTMALPEVAAVIVGLAFWKVELHETSSFDDVEECGEKLRQQANYPLLEAEIEAKEFINCQMREIKAKSGVVLDMSEDELALTILPPFAMANVAKTMVLNTCN